MNTISSHVKIVLFHLIGAGPKRRQAATAAVESMLERIAAMDVKRQQAALEMRQLEIKHQEYLRVHEERRDSENRAHQMKVLEVLASIIKSNQTT